MRAQPSSPWGKINVTLIYKLKKKICLVKKTKFILKGTSISGYNQLVTARRKDLKRTTDVCGICSVIQRLKIYIFKPEAKMSFKLSQESLNSKILSLLNSKEIFDFEN